MKKKTFRDQKRPKHMIVDATSQLNCAENCFENKQCITFFLRIQRWIQKWFKFNTTDSFSKKVKNLCDIRLHFELNFLFWKGNNKELKRWSFKESKALEMKFSKSVKLFLTKNYHKINVEFSFHLKRHLAKLEEHWFIQIYPKIA